MKRGVMTFKLLTCVCLLSCIQLFATPWTLYDPLAVPGFCAWDSSGKKRVQFSSVAQSCLTHCDPMNHSTPGLPVHHQLPEFTQTHVHQVCSSLGWSSSWLEQLVDPASRAHRSSLPRDQTLVSCNAG